MLLRMLPILRDEYGYAPEVCCLKETGEMYQDFLDAGLKVHVIPFQSRLDPRGLMKLRKLIKAKKFSIVHGHMYASNMAVNFATIGLKNTHAINSYHSQTPWRGSSQGRMIRWTKNIPERIVAVSEAVRSPLLKLSLPTDKYRIIHNGVIVSDSCPPLPVRQEGSPVLLMWAGRFVKQKRVDRLVLLADQLKKKRVPFYLTLVGDGPTFQRIKQQASDLGLADEVCFLGWKKEIKEEVRKAEIYVSASDREGFPNTLLEVCAQGRPFVVQDIPPNREVLGESEAGICCGENLDDWVEQISKLQKNRERIGQMADAAYKRVHEFSVQNTCLKTHEMYQQLF